MEEEEEDGNLRNLVNSLAVLVLEEEEEEDWRRRILFVTMCAHRFAHLRIAQVRAHARKSRRKNTGGGLERSAPD